MRLQTFFNNNDRELPREGDRNCGANSTRTSMGVLSLSLFLLPPFHTRLLSDQVEERLKFNNIFTIARRSVDVGGQPQELMYLSLKFVNNIWVLAELKITPGSASISVSVHVLNYTTSCSVLLMKRLHSALFPLLGLYLCY